MPRTCPNCRVTEGSKHASWCNHGKERMQALGNRTPNVELLDMLAELTGLFGKRGWAEIKVVMADDKTVRTCPLPEHGYEIVQRARMLLRERNREAIVP